MRLRSITQLDEALKLAPRLDRRAAEYNAQFSDEPFPTGASERFLRMHLNDPETLLLVAEEANGELAAICLIGALIDPLLRSRTPMVLVLHVEDAARHRGLAGEIISEARGTLADRGIRTLAARVGHNDDALISMGERWGFVRNWELMLHE
jgi:GNAT superfamily N-acetyltransferase